VSRLSSDLMQPENSRSAMPAAPILILLSAPIAPIDVARTAPPFAGDPRVLGLDLLQRTIKAARRAGYGRIFSLARDHAVPPGIVTIPNWSYLESVLVPSQIAPLLIVPAAILSETDWLERLAKMRIEPATWATAPHRIVMLTAAAVPDALAVLQTDGGAYDLAAVQDRLTHRFGSPMEIPAGIDPIVVATPMDVRVAERRLLRGLVKDTDGFMARHVERPLSLQVSRYLAPTVVTPNQISIVSIVIGLCGALFFLSAFSTWQTVGAVLLLAHSILDGCDGELARLKFQESRWGGVLDFWGDNIVHMATFTCMAAGWALSVNAAWPLLLGATAVLGNLSSATFVYWRLMRVKNDSGPLFTTVTTAPNRRLARLLDAASRRDFMYLVLVLALFGKSNWFLLLASLGAPIFFFFLVFLAMRERLTITPTTSGA
jgi:1L-myo-inositol 1-phosphate cytidylyltransferase / CDP-L-myo-inositol myo-inositolphosphotransferase